MVASDGSAKSKPNDGEFDPFAIQRPHDKLLTYYTLCCAFAGPFFPIAFLPAYFKFKTLTYKIDEEGISMSWGILFRREIYLTYRRIQDIHLTRNLFQRWFGLATVGVQTASGSSSPEMSIEGILEAPQLRDFLYSRMRGAKDGESDTHEEPVGEESVEQLLTEVRDALRSLSKGSA